MMREELTLVSMACRFPGAPSTQDFWENLKQGKDLLSEIPPTRWDAQRYYDPQPGVSGKCATRKGYFLADVRQFDPGFFKIQPEDALVMDPQQRILLELCFEAFASAGYQRERLSGQKVGVFMGITKSDYQNNIAEALARQELTQKTVVTGILENLIAARISHYFDLTGPALTIDTACSSSLVALHLAKESILAGDCEMALVGGINLNLNVPAFLGMSAAQALSPGEQFHVFDQRANGFFMGEGGAVVLLKKRSQALADQDRILAVLAGSAVNNDGRSISPMAPRSSTQQAVLLKACQDAQLNPAEITLIEAHGTGTPLGDAVEAQTLNAVFAGISPKPVLGSVKPNIGHLLSAAGMGSLIKVLLCFQHRQIPPLLHYAQPRKELQLETQGFCLNQNLLEIPAGQPMVAGINGFGFGGTNAHILLRAESDSLPQTDFRQVLPAYQKRDYWVGLKEQSAPETNIEPEVRVFETRWFARDLPRAATPNLDTGPWLILAEPLQVEAQELLVESLRQAGQPCLCLPSWAAVEDPLQTDPRAFQLLLCLPLSARALYNFLQTLAKSPLLARCKGLTVITQGALPVGSELASNPSSSQGTRTVAPFLASGLLWGASSELNLPVLQVDLAPGEICPQLGDLALCLLHLDSQAQSPPQTTSQLALRGKHLWQRSQRQVSLTTEPPLPSRIRAKGVYLITGGASGIGALIAESLVEQQTQLQLLVVGRREACEVPGLADLQARIQAKGSQLHYFRVDVSQPAEVRALCQHILRKYAGLHGVVHAAGQVMPKDLRRSPYQERQEGMAPKVEGVIALRDSLVDLGLSPDFFLAFSSLSAALPGFGRGLIDYVAANHFMDLYANAVSRSALPIQVIQWGPWQGAGMATHPALLKQLADQGIYALSPAEGLSAFHAFIDGALAQALIFKSPHHQLKVFSERLIAADPPQDPPQETLSSSNPAPTASASPSPIATSTQSPSESLPQADLELRLMHLIQDVLDQSGQAIEIGPEDNLMDLGIDSLIAIDLTQTLEDWGYQDLPFELFFEQQNIRELARYLLVRSHLLAESPTAPEPPLRLEHPLSPIQTAFFVAQTLYERPNYSYFRLSLSRLLDPQLLEQALWDLLEQQTQLRSVFQQSLDASGMKLNYQILSRAQLQADLQTRPNPALIQEISAEWPLPEYEEFFVNQLFALNQAPLFRIGLQQSAQGSHLLLLFHHIVFDGISMKNFLQGLWARYRGLETQTPFLAPPLALSYEDYVQTVQDYRETEAFRAAILACSNYLTSQPLKPQSQPLTSQPFLFELAERYAALGSVPAQSQQRRLPQASNADLSAALSKQAQNTQTPLQMLYLSAFFEALSEWSGQSQLWVQVASAGRHWPLAEIHSLIGSFAELFPVYADLGLNQGLALAQHLRQQWNSAQPLLRVGADQITQMAQEQGISLPFSFSFAHFDYAWMSPADQAQVLDTQMRGFHAQTQLGLLISENHQGFYYAFNTPQGLFADAELERLAQLFEAALSRIAESAAPDFWRDFQRAPDQAVALKTPESEVSYAELRHAVKQLAYQLESRGLSCGSVLVFWGEASIDSICLLLACLALGVTWVPVDAQSPAQRVEEICRQAKADLQVCDLPEMERDKRGLLSLSELLKQAQESQETAFRLPERSENAVAYLIFTSGSTGQPKGVPILYSALMRYLGWAIESFGYGPQDRVILTSSLAFDASLRPILATLMRGACLCPVNDQIKRDPLALLRWVRAAQITVWSSVPGLWQGLIQALEGQAQESSQPSSQPSSQRLSQPWNPDNDPLPQLRLVQLGGEVLTSQWLERWQTLMGSERPLVNLYGPTETTINATHYWVRGPHPKGQPVPIGEALPYLSCRVMSVAGEPCSSGEAGELWVSGPSLTPGYLSAEDPFVMYLGERYYRTGDRVYQDAEGRFFFLGRQDRQIKLRGYRLEPAEIEAVLLRFPDLREAWVDTLPSPSGSQQLVACVSSAVPLDQIALMKHLAQFLPGYMLPQQIYGCSAFPRLPNGKADLAALRQTLLGPQEALQTEASPTDALATEVREIWQSVLKRQDFVESSDFFQMGGDSLLLMQAYLLLQQRWPQLPKIAKFHSQRRLQDWVGLLHSALSSAPEPLATSPGSFSASPETQPTTQPLPETGFGLSPSQMGFYLWHKHLKRDDSLWEARIVLEGELDPERFEMALMQTARRQQMLNVQLLATQPPVFVPVAEPKWSFEYHDLSAAREALPAMDICLDIFKDPLLRCRLLKQGPRSYLWQIQAHHILADGLSCLILGRELFATYRQLLKVSQPQDPQLHQPPQLPPLRSQFSAYISLLEHERQSHGETHLRYWQTVFDQPYLAPNLRSKDLNHLDSAEPAGFFRLERRLHNRELAVFQQRCQAACSTLFMGVLAAYHQALVILTGQADLIIGVAHHGRDYALEEIEQIFGCFARTLPLRLPASAPASAPPSAPDPASPLISEQQIQAAQKHYQAAAAHPLDPLGLLRTLSPAPRLATLLGSQFFISALDLTPLLEAEIVPGLRINGQASSTHFQPSNQDMDLFLALKQQGEYLILTLNVHREACSHAQAEALLDQLLLFITEPAQPQAARIQFRPFDLAQTGPIDAALISYLPALEQIKRVAPRLSHDQIQALKQGLFKDEQALWIESLHTPLGQSANLVLPFFANEILPGQAKRILPAIQSARLQAQALGARVVSLAGLLPALTAYGHDLPAIPSLASALQIHHIPQRLSTGHSTTVVAMLETLRFALAQLERSLSSCRLAMVGLGSIGEATLNALLARLDHPASLTLVDRLGSEQRMQQLAERLAAQHGYSGPLQWILSPAESLPTEVYQADLILSAVSARQVIDISQLRPGTVLIDDSFPHCFDVMAAITRMEQERDVLVIGGGLLQLPGCLQTRYLPLPDPQLQAALTQVSLPACLPGCQLESLLLAAYPELPETLGLVEPDKLLQYLPVIQAAGIQAAPLHLEGYLVPPELIQELIQALTIFPWSQGVY